MPVIIGKRAARESARDQQKGTSLPCMIELHVRYDNPEDIVSTLDSTALWYIDIWIYHDKRY